MNSTKIALVTGGNRGIGLAIVKGLLDKGMTVLMGCRDTSAGQEAAKSLNGNVHVVPLDLSSEQSLAVSIEFISQHFPHIDILINNAAILDDTNLSQISYEGLVESMHVNAFAPFRLAQLFGEKMVQQGYGRIVNVSSGWGTTSGLLDSPILYGLSKSLLNAMTRVLAQNIQATDSTVDVKINAMCPGWVRTRMGGDAATRSPEQGAETAIYLATLADDGLNGMLFRDKQVIDW